MGLANNFPSVIHESSEANFNKYVYYEVFAGEASNVIINGTFVRLPTGYTVRLKISSISADTSTVYLLGSSMDSASGMSYSGTTNEYQLGGSAFL
jgi:hypothetical protein